MIIVAFIKITKKSLNFLKQLCHRRFAFYINKCSLQHGVMLKYLKG